MYTQKQKQLTAHQRVAVHNIFGNTMEFLEKYIEIAGYYSDWEKRKQILNNDVTRKDIIGNPEKAEKAFSVILFGLRQALKENQSPKLREELRVEFYRWIDGVRISVDDCDPRLKNVLVGMHEILEGRDEKIMEEVLNRERVTDIDSPDYAERLNEIFAGVQVPLEEGRKREKLLEGVNPDEVEVRKVAAGVFEKGKQSFEKIAETLSTSDYHQNFHYFKQKKQQQTAKTNSLDEYKQWEQEQEAMEIARSSNQSNARQEIRWDLINNIKQHIKEFRIEKVAVLGKRGGYSEEEEEWIIHNSAKRDYELGFLVFDPDKMVKVRDLNEAERKELGITTQSSQNYKQGQRHYSAANSQSRQTKTEPSSKDNNSKVGIIATISVLGISTISGAVLIKKKLNKKVKNRFLEFRSKD